MKTRTLIRLLGVIASLMVVQVATGQAPAGAPAGATGLCKDGTYYTGTTKQGACRGHQGVKDWYGATPSSGKSSSTATSASNTSGSTATTPATPASTPAKSTAATSAPKTDNAAPAPGGGPDKVWVNTASNVYHCPGTKYYGTTKAGAYMTEADAKAKGARPDHGKPCK